MWPHQNSAKGECAHAVSHRGLEQANGKIGPIEINRSKQPLRDFSGLGILLLVHVARDLTAQRLAIVILQVERIIRIDANVDAGQRRPQRPYVLAAEYAAVVKRQHFQLRQMWQDGQRRGDGVLSDPQERPRRPRASAIPGGTISSKTAPKLKHSSAGAFRAAPSDRMQASAGC